MVRAFTFSALILLTGSARGAVINGDFEDGLNGWTIFEITAPDATGTVEEFNGSNQLKLWFGNTVNQSRVEVSQSYTIANAGYVSFDYHVTADPNDNGDDTISFLANIDGVTQLFLVCLTAGTNRAPTRIRSS